MAAMKKIMDGVSPIALCIDVKKETMQWVLDKCPQKNSTGHQESYKRKRYTHLNRLGDGPAYNWQPNDWNCPPNSAGQELPKITLKKSRAFLANNRLVNPLLIRFTKIADLVDKGLIQIDRKLLRNHLGSLQCSRDTMRVGSESKRTRPPPPRVLGREDFFIFYLFLGVCCCK